MGGGNRDFRIIARRCQGSIPAWAGETQRRGCSTIGLEVYPRVGGGNKQERFILQIRSGLSPRGRGKPRRTAQRAVIRRSIPAWAGETVFTHPHGVVMTVYPRVGGGNSETTGTRKQERGLSPRGRGKPPPPMPPTDLSGSIPAWAGETLSLVSQEAESRVYPRVGGGNEGMPTGAQDSGGLSPRGRGKQTPKLLRMRQRRSIPAWAGETS